MPRSSNAATLPARRRCGGRRRAPASSSTPAARAESAIGTCGERGHDLLDAARRARRGTRGRRGPPRTSDAEHRGEQPRVGARADLRGGCRRARPSRCGAGRSTISARPGSLAISLSVARARGKPCDCHGFLPTNTATSACSKSPLDAARRSSWPSTQNSPVFSWASALERYIDAERRRSGAAVARRRGGSPARRRRSRRSTRRRGASRTAREPRRDLADRGVPVDLLERAVGAAPQRRGSRSRAVLVVVEAERLLARVALEAGWALSPRIRSKRRPSSPPRRTSIPQLHSQRMQAVVVASRPSSPSWVIVTMNVVTVSTETPPRPGGRLRSRR